MDYRNLGERIESAAPLDAIAQPLRQAVAKVLPAGTAKDAMHGVWLGHPLHPLLTDLPIGFWTSAWVLDIVGGKKGRPAAQALVGLGVLSAVPTAVTGLADWSELNRPEQRTGLVHAVANGTATALFAMSWLARRRGRHGRGVALSWAGSAAATAGGFLGGHLSFRRAAGVNHAADAPDPQDWTSVTADSEISADEPARLELDGTPLVAAKVAAGDCALAARCTHLGGPLHEGSLDDGCVRCPWHGSTFRMTDGSVVHGPATAPQPAYDLRSAAGRLEARRKPPP
jgi:nitrite reductase/ring-hydroxylating ferredoxin subunit/uncharacterized membrane protein